MQESWGSLWQNNVDSKIHEWIPGFPSTYRNRRTCSSRTGNESRKQAKLSQLKQTQLPWLWHCSPSWWGRMVMRYRHWMTDFLNYWLKTFRISVFETFLFCLLVCQAFISLGNHDELGTCFRIVFVPVRMVNQGQFTISLLNLFHRCVLFNSQDFIRIKSFQILWRSRDLNKTHWNSDKQNDQQNNLGMRKRVL